MPQEQLKTHKERQGRNVNFFMPDELSETLDFFSDNLVSQPWRWIVVAYLIDEILVPLKEEYEKAVLVKDDEKILDINKRMIKIQKKYSKYKR